MRNENKIVHGMWFGTQLSRLELLTLHSFVRFGHEFHLWAYDDLSRYDFPAGVVLRDAEKIIPRRSVFAKSDRDAETGVGRGSFGAPFSDLFRYKLLRKHGGIWVDMDVTCLRPFDFSGEYAFRPHRIGVVGSILKCPPGSLLMRRVYDETLRLATPESDYLLPNRILTKHIEALGLKPYVIETMSNPDHWIEFVRPMIEGSVELPDEWYAIHWINEMWRTLQADDGKYRGKKLIGYTPDKDAPLPGSTLWEMYRSYGLIDPRQGPFGLNVVPTKFGKPAPTRAARLFRDQPKTATYFNVLLPSVVRGGAERSVIETMAALQKTGGLTQKLFVLHRSRQQYPIHSADNFKVVFAENSSDIAATMRSFALDMWETSTPLIYTHLIPASHLRYLWDMGIATVPVIQNMSPGWTDSPLSYENEDVPFIVGVSDAVSAELRASGVRKPVVTIRHELQRTFAPADLTRHRREIRDRHGIAENVFVIGMVGQFKSQKAYTRAVRVLHEVRHHVPAKLMILGGWDHEYGAGRAAYEAMCRRAVELGVIADIILPGDTYPIEPYLAAFDVFLNTSIYEGLSVALLEALHAGCPVVTADAGGNREVLPADAVLVADGTNIQAYAKGILGFVNRPERVLPPGPADPALVPRLWCQLAKHGIANSVTRTVRRSGTLFLTETLQIGGPQTSLVNLLTNYPTSIKTAVCALQGVPIASHKCRLDNAHVPILLADGAASLPEKAEFILNWADKLDVASICFWNVNPETKLLLAKILSIRNIRLIDVSPGPMLFDELDACAEFQRRTSLSARQYFDRLDAFVTKYENGMPPESLCSERSKIYVIRNGVSKPPNFIPLPVPEHILPPGFDPKLAIVTCCRVVPDKRLEFLMEAMTVIADRSPGASLTIIGGADVQSADYMSEIRLAFETSGLTNVFFTGWQENVMPFLAQFPIFVMVSDRQGCPNASLEAMALGLPVVANRSGGVDEQIENGVTGYLVDTPAEMAASVLALQKNNRLRKKMGRAARALAMRKFSLENMVASYVSVLENTEGTALGEAANLRSLRQTDSHAGAKRKKRTGRSKSS